MAKTVDNFSTIENFRQTYNELATDVGTISGLQTPRQGNIVDALNSVNEKDFFFQEFIYVVSSQGTVSFSGNDNVGNLLKFRDDRIQVFVRGEHLIEGIDYVISNQNSDGTYGQITLQGDYADGGSKETEVNDRVVVYSYTGSYLGVAVSSTGSSFFQLSDTNSVYNNNQNGVILNGDSTSITSQLETGFTLQLAGKTFAEDDITLATGKTLTAPTVTDGTASLSSGSLTSAVNGTFSGTVTGGTLTDGTASITGGAGTGFSSITSTSFVGDLTGQADTVAALKGIPTREQLLDLLGKEVCYVTFNKLSGDERKMHCTLIPSMLPPAQRDDKLSQTKIRNLEDKVFVVWAIDIEPSAWRSFRYDRVTKVEVDNYYGNGHEDGANY